MTCISCDNVHNENFCPNCGERKGVRKITISSIVEDAFSTVTNMDKGFLFNIKALLLQPKQIITDYINGKRKGVLNPISYLIIAITIYLILQAVLKTPKDPSVIRRVPDGALQRTGYEAGYFIAGHLKYYWIFTILPLGLILKVIFRKFNFLEHVAISAFIIGQATLVGLISYAFLKVPLLYDPVVYFTIVWMIYRVFKEKNKIESALLALTTFILFVILLFILIALIGWMRI